MSRGEKNGERRCVAEYYLLASRASGERGKPVHGLGQTGTEKKNKMRGLVLRKLRHNPDRRQKIQTVHLRKNGFATYPGEQGKERVGYTSPFRSNTEGARAQITPGSISCVTAACLLYSLRAERARSAPTKGRV